MAINWKDKWMWQTVLVYACVLTASLSYMTSLLVPGIFTEMLRGRPDFPLTGDSSSQNTELTADVAKIKSYYDGLNSLLGVVFVPIFGAMSDVYGRRNVMIISLIGTAITTIISYVAYYYNLLSLFFIGNFAGAMRDGIQVCSLAYMSDVCRGQGDSVRAFRFGMILAMYQAGMLVGSPLFGYLAKYSPIVSYGFVLCLLAIMIPMCIIFLQDLPKVKEIKEGEQQQQQQEEEEESVKRMTLAAINPFRFFYLLFGNGRFLAALVIAYTLAFLGITDVITIGIQYAEYRFHWTPFQYGIQMSISTAVGILVQSFGLKAVLKCFGDSVVIVTALFIFSGTHVLLGLSYLPWMYFTSNILSQFALLNLPALQSQISKGIPTHQQAAGLGALSSLSNIAMFFGSLIMGNSFAYFISKGSYIRIPGIAFFIGASCFCLAAIICWVNFGTYTSSSSSSSPVDSKPISIVEEKNTNRKSMTFETMDENTPLTISVIKNSSDENTPLLLASSVNSVN